MAENTKNLNLKKPAPEDFYNIEDFNENFQKIDDFVGRKDNPHGVTKEQVGLGDVENTSTNDQTPTYTESTVLTNLTSGEKLSVAFGKIKKAITDFISHINDTAKHNHSATGGAAIGKDATTGNNSGGAVGYKAATGGGGAVGDNAKSNSGGGIGYLAEAANGGAIGEEAKSNNGGAIGYKAKTANGCAIGHMARTVNQDGVEIDAIQLGTGTNTKEKSMQVYDYTLLDADGTIPIERLVKGVRIGTGTYTGTGEAGSDTKSCLLFEFNPKVVFVTAGGHVTSDAIMFVRAADSNYAQCYSRGGTNGGVLFSGYFGDKKFDMIRHSSSSGSAWNVEGYEYAYHYIG